MEHSGKHALVTGGGTGIGLDIALMLADAGAEVTITGRRVEVLEAVEHPRIHPLAMDVSNEDQVRKGIVKAAAERGPVQICIANAGIAEGGPFDNITLADWRRMMAINLDGAFLTMQECLTSLPKDMDGRFIAISSIAGVKGLKGAIPYTVSKHGLIGLIRGLSEEFMKRPVTFNAVCPGYVETDIVRNQIPGIMRRFDTDEAGAAAIMASGNRHKNLLQVEEITSAVRWLCTPGARSVNGQTVEISGGQV